MLQEPALDLALETAGQGARMTVLEEVASVNHELRGVATRQARSASFCHRTAVGESVGDQVVVDLQARASGPLEAMTWSSAVHQLAEVACSLRQQHNRLGTLAAERRELQRVAALPAEACELVG
jgi:hypothetical protein